MKINILGKVNRLNYKSFSNADFPAYEVFLGSEKDFKYLPAMARRLKIASVHEPAGGFDLAAPEEKGKKSYALMVRLLNRLDGLGFNGVMVIHGVFYNELKKNKAVCQKTLAKRLDKLALKFRNIKISLETDILFFNQIEDNRALVGSPEDFLELKKYLKSRLYITLDFEHVLISALFQDFIKKNKKHYRRIKNLAEINLPFSLEAKTAWFNYLKKNTPNFDKIYSASLKKYEKLNGAIIHFHLSPSDMFGYWFDEKIFAPLKGEHLSIGQANDKLNYSLIKRYLPELTIARPINVVLEIWPRKTGRYVLELKQSGKIIKNKWRMKN